MNWEAANVILGGAVLAIGFINAYLIKSMQLENARSKEELRDWINGSFMRSKEVEARLVAMEGRIERLEESR